MKPTDKKWPQSNAAGRQPQRPTTPAHHFKPPVVQTKSAAPASARPHPAAPPAYRPQATPRVLQRKAAEPPPTTPPVGPPAYRPQSAPKAAQTKSLQAPFGNGGAANRPPASEVKGPTPAYRPQPAPKCLQLKSAVGRKPLTAQPDDKLQAPAASRLQPLKPAPPKSSPAAQAGGAGVLQRLRWKFLGDGWEPQDWPDAKKIPPPPPHPEDDPVIAHVRVNDIYDDKNKILRNAVGAWVTLKGPDGKKVRSDAAPAAAAAVPKHKAGEKKAAAPKKKTEDKAEAKKAFVGKERKAPTDDEIVVYLSGGGGGARSKDFRQAGGKKGKSNPYNHAEQVALTYIETNNIAGDIYLVQNAWPCGKCLQLFKTRKVTKDRKITITVTADSGDYSSDNSLPKGTTGKLIINNRDFVYERDGS